MSKEIKIGDEVVFNDPALDMVGKWEVMSIQIGVRPSRKLNDKIKYINSGLATRTGATYDHTSLLDILSVPKPK
jgi:hypothetical protein